ncbi:hypothetical protein WK91_18545 [Burkholderia cepacia]|uniref:hypothetical protein n=1 Tax=Burkholderia cepacia TaxID=292 RepID=UPI00075C6B4F|nr:hypothetical protein [Burkholderia cepacia]KVW15435.1 hypothetical protein WK91_18545 [Burkholderia cepacia]
MNDQQQSRADALTVAAALAAYEKASIAASECDSIEEARIAFVHSILAASPVEQPAVRRTHHAEGCRSQECEDCKWAQRQGVSLCEGCEVLANVNSDAVEQPAAAPIDDREPPAVSDLPRFPTVLRKMWSGTEVQQWIDDNIKPLVQERHHDSHCGSNAAPSPADDLIHLTDEQIEKNREAVREWWARRDALRAATSPADERAALPEMARKAFAMAGANHWHLSDPPMAEAIVRAVLDARASSATKPADERAAFGAEWMLVKRERIDEIKRYAYPKFEESYQGRGLYDEDAVRRNANLGEEMLTNIQSELEWIDEDTKDFEAERAASANETGAEGVRAWETDDGRVISDEQKQQALRDGGASASSVRPFSIALGRIGGVPAMAAEAAASPAAEVAQWQSRLKDRSSPAVDRWVNISQDGAKTLMEKYADVYEVRALYDAPQPAQADAPAEAREPSIVAAALTGLARHVRAVSAYSKLVGDMEMVDQAIALLNSAPASAGEAAIPRVHGISHSADNPCTVLVKLMAEPSDDALRAIHNMLTAPPAARVASLTDEQILDVFRDAGLDLNATTNMLYAVRGQHAQLVKAARVLLNGADHDE